MRDRLARGQRDRSQPDHRLSDGSASPASRGTWAQHRGARGSSVRPTVTIEPDVAAAVAELQRRRSSGLSAAVNELVRTGLAQPPVQRQFHQRSTPLGLRLDVLEQEAGG